MFSELYYLHPKTKVQNNFKDVISLKEGKKRGPTLAKTLSTQQTEGLFFFLLFNQSGSEQHESPEGNHKETRPQVDVVAQ